LLLHEVSRFTDAAKKVILGGRDERNGNSRVPTRWSPWTATRLKTCRLKNQS